MVHTDSSSDDLGQIGAHGEQRAQRRSEDASPSSPVARLPEVEDDLSNVVSSLWTLDERSRELDNFRDVTAGEGGRRSDELCPQW